MRTNHFLAAVCGVSLACTAWAQPASDEAIGNAQQSQQHFGSAQSEEEPVLNLSATASAQVKYDEVVLTLSKEERGADEKSVSSQLNTALKAVNDKAQGNDKINLETGLYNVWLEPMVKDNDEKKVWHGQAEIKVKSKDLSAASSFAAAASESMTLSGIDFRLTDELRKKTESDLREQAFKAFKSKAQSSAKALGYRDISIHKITLQDSDGGAGREAPVMMRAMSYEQTDAQNAAVPLESGIGTVTITVSGEVVLKK